MKSENVNVLKLKYLMAEFEDTGNPQFAIEVCELLRSGYIKISASNKDNRLYFLLASKYKSVCQRCGEEYSFGDQIFVRNKKGWHIECATEDELQTPFFLDCQEKGLINDFEKKNLKA